jgi:hypothetical protein
MLMIPAGLRTKNDCAGEDQQQFTRSTGIAKSIQYIKVNRTHAQTLYGLYVSSGVIPYVGLSTSYGFWFVVGLLYC